MRPEREPSRNLPRPLPELEEEREVDFGRLARKLLARWWLILGAIVAGAVIGYLLSLGGGDVYQARATVNLGTPLTPGGGSSIQTLATNPATVGQIARSDSVVQAVAAEVGVPADQLARGVSTKAVGGQSTRPGTVSPLVEISVRGPWQEESAEAANLISATVVERTSGYVNVKIESLEEQLASQNRELASIERRIDAFQQAVGSSGSLTPLERLTVVTQIGFAEQRRGELLDQQVDTRQLLQLAKQVEQGAILTRAAAQEVQARSSSSSVLVGALLGLLVGAALAFLWEPLSGRRRAAAS